MNFKRLPKLSFKTILFILIVFSLGVGFGQKFLTNPQSKPQDEIEKNTPKAFVSEIYDKIKENYWNNISDAELLDLFKLSIAKNGGNINVPKFEDKNKLLSAISETTKDKNYEQKAEELKKDNSPQAAEKLKQLTYAKDVLTSKDTKEKYDQNKVEPTIFTKIAGSGVLYLQFK